MKHLHLLLEDITMMIESDKILLYVYEQVKNVALYEENMEKVIKTQKSIEQLEKELNKLYDKQEKIYKQLLIEYL